MRQLMMLVAVAAVAGAMYVAAASGSQQSKGPTAKQFAALKKQVATLNKNLKNTTAVASTALGVIADCYVTVGASTVTDNGLGVSQRGTSTTGYLFGTTATATPTTALDIASSSPKYYLQEVTPACVAGNLAKHRAGHSAGSLLQHWAERAR